MAYAAGEDPSSERAWIVLILLVTLVAGAVVGQWSVVLVTVLGVAMVLPRRLDLATRRSLTAAIRALTRGGQWF
jgi:hypothetical protein